MERAVEPLRERELFLVGEWLITEHEDGVFVQSPADLVERLAVVDTAEVDRAHLGDEARVQRTEAKSHDSSVGATHGRGQAGACLRGVHDEGAAVSRREGDDARRPERAP